MINRVYLDFETRSECDLHECGASVYTRHPSTIIICANVRKNGQSLTIFDMENHGHELLYFIGDSPIVAHNAWFEQEVWANILVPRHNFPQMPIERFMCTMAKACKHSLPRGLDKCADALNLIQRKDAEGYKLMLRMSDARTGKNPYEKVCTPENLIRLGQYCEIDNITAEGIDDTLPDICAYERQVWVMDQQINREGIRVDLALVVRLREIAAYEKALLQAEFRQLVALEEGLDSPTQVAKFKTFLEEKSGRELKDLSKRTVELLLRDSTFPQELKRALELRQALSKSSTAKLEKLLTCTAADGITRGSTIYFGAHTGRWAGADIQPQNFPSRRPKHWPDDIVEQLLATIDDAEELWPVKWGSCIEPIKHLLRACLIADHFDLEDDEELNEVLDI